MAVAGKFLHYASYFAFLKEMIEMQRLAQCILIAKILFGNFFGDDDRIGLLKGRSRVSGNKWNGKNAKNRRIRPDNLFSACFLITI